MFKLVSLVGLSMAVVMVIAATSRGDDSSSTETTEAPPVPEWSFKATVPFGSNPSHDPNKPYDVGPPGTVVQYEELTAAEKAQVDRGRDTSQWDAVHDVYAQAAAERDKEMKALIAAQRLGVDGLQDVGVVP